MLTILGAGSVGLSVGGHLSASGVPVLILARGSALAETIQRDGVVIEDPVTGNRRDFSAQSMTVDQLTPADTGGGPVLICTRTTQTEEAARALKARVPDVPVVSMQNDVVNEAILSKHFDRVIGAVYRRTCFRVADNVVRTTGAGRVCIGAYSEGVDGIVAELADQLKGAGYDVGISDNILADKWLKLAVNLMSTPNALIKSDEHSAPAFAQAKVTLLEEARSVFEAAQLEVSSCDGTDRSLDDEIEFQKAARSRGPNKNKLPLYNSVWRTLKQGLDLEADAYHRRIIELANKVGMSAPANERALAVLERAVRENLGPASVHTAEFFGDEAQ